MITRLVNGDCLQVMDKLIADGVQVDAIITDPPYGATSMSWDSILPFDEMWPKLSKLVKPNGAIVLFGTNPFASLLVASNTRQYRHEWVWVKNKPTGAFSAKYSPMKATESILVFSVEKADYFPIMVRRTPEEYKAAYRKNDSTSWGNNIQNSRGNVLKRKSEDQQWFKYPTNVLPFDKDDKRNGMNHPTQKPAALMEYLIKTYTQPGGTVLDFTMGSGSTGVAAVNTDRSFIGIELDDKYFTIAKNRIDDAKRQPRLLSAEVAV